MLEVGGTGVKGGAAKDGAGGAAEEGAGGAAAGLAGGGIGPGAWVWLRAGLAWAGGLLTVLARAAPLLLG